MTETRDFDAAVAAGIITADQAKRLSTFLATEAIADGDRKQEGDIGLGSAADEEHVRFARGFQDIFLTLGIGLLLVGIAIAGPMTIGLIPGFTAGAAIAFGLSWIFARRMRLVLPSIALAIGFTAFAGATAAAVLDNDSWELIEGAADGRVQLIVGIVMLAASILFYAAYRLPFVLALIALSATFAAFGAVVALAGPDIDGLRLPVFLLAGIAIFLVAMRFDLSDPGRQSIRADKAFWLHLAAAPMIVHAGIGLAVGGGEEIAAAAAITVLLVLLIGLVALIIDRRAMLVASLVYLGIAVAGLMNEANMTTSGVLAATLVLIGSFVVALGIGWRPLRKMIVPLLPGPSLVRRLPPV